jgi:DNA mismatch repair protein MutS
MAEHTIRSVSQALSDIDVACANAYLAARDGHVCPHVDDSKALSLIKGRHPVVERALITQNSAPFAPNDCTFTPAKHFWLITGPNMGGKSTFLRQNALIILMAQAGFYVPCESAHIGIVDRIFSRVGASDDLAAGRSTFMVEMVETAAILHQATDRSFVILDEIGRGTSTYDGLALAWAVVEYIHDTLKCRALFATHYHELTHLQETLDGFSCLTVCVQEWNGTILFLHTVKEGVADRSYGIHVAKKAGIPKGVLERAHILLEGFEKNKVEKTQLHLTFAPKKKPPVYEKSPVEMYINDVNLDTLSPKEALDMMYALKEMIHRRQAA